MVAAGHDALALVALGARVALAARGERQLVVAEVAGLARGARRAPALLGGLGVVAERTAAGLLGFHVRFTGERTCVVL